MSQPPRQFIGDLSACLARLNYGAALKRELLAQSIPATTLAAPLLDAVALFGHLGITSALAGGIAAMFYGRARFTENINFIAALGHRDLLAASPQAIRQFHFDPQLRHTSGIQLTIAQDPHSGQMLARAIPATLADHQIPIVEMHDLIAMNLRAGRLQDDFDISEIAKHQQLDLDRLHPLLTADEFIRFQQILARS